MAGKTVTKTIENVDKLFASIVVNGEEHVSERYISPASVAVSSTPAPKVSQKKTIRSTLPATRSGTDAQATQGEDVYGVELNNILHNFVDRVVTQGLADEITARQSADALLSGFINALNALVPEGASSSNKLVSASQLNVVQASVSDIEDLIPSQASDQNQLADKSFVNSSIATNTANFLGTYTTLADIQAIQNPTNNDYAFLQTTDSAGNTKFDRYKYNSESSQWLYEYTLNNSSFTAEQWATINSGLTASSVSDAIGALDVASVGGSGKYIESISEVDGKIVPVEASIATSVALNNLHSVSSDAVAKALLLKANIETGAFYLNFPRSTANLIDGSYVKIGSIVFATTRVEITNSLNANDYVNIPASMPAMNGAKGCFGSWRVNLYNGYGTIQNSGTSSIWLIYNNQEFNVGQKAIDGGGMLQIELIYFT